MSEHITHLAVFEDAARLALVHPRVHSDLKQSLKSGWRAGSLGAVTRSGDAFSVGVFKNVRAAWDRSGPDKQLERKLAFVLGWRVHQAADRRFKPVFRQLQPKHYEFDRGFPPDVTVYHDVVVFREVYDSGRLRPFHPSVLDNRLESHPLAAHFDTAFAEAILRSCWQQPLLRNQRFLAHESIPAPWQKLLETRMEPFHVDVRRYAGAYAHPDPGWYQHFIVAPKFYHREDPLLRYARALQRGGSTASLDLLASIASAGGQSQYAEAVANGVGYILAASAYWNREIDETELKRLFHIGSSHLRTPPKESEQ